MILMRIRDGIKSHKEHYARTPREIWIDDKAILQLKTNIRFRNIDYSEISCIFGIPVVEVKNLHGPKGKIDWLLIDGTVSW